MSTCPSGRVCQRYGSDEPRPTWRCRPLRDFEQKITKVSIAPPFGPARGSQPGAQAGWHALEIRKWDVRNVKIGPVIRDRSDEASRGNASGGERHVAFRGAKDHTLLSPRIMPVIRPASTQMVAGTAGSTNSRRSRGAHRQLGAWVVAFGFRSFLFYLNYTEPGKRRRAPCSIRRRLFSSNVFFDKVFGQCLGHPRSVIGHTGQYDKRAASKFRRQLDK